MDVEVIQKLPNYILKDKFLVLSEKDTLLFQGLYNSINIDA